MAKRSKGPIRAAKKKQSGSGAATMILFCAVGVGLFIGIAGFESGAATRAAAERAGVLSTN